MKVNLYRPSGNYSVSTDRQRRDDGQARIWDETHNAYLTDSSGDVLTFATAHDAQAWLNRQWLLAQGIDVWPSDKPIPEPKR